MTWIKLEDNLTDHPKFVGISDAGFATWVRGMLYSSRHLLDGELPRTSQSVLGRPKAIAELVERDLWRETIGGWLIVNYGKFQRLKADIEADRVATSERQRKRRDKDAGNAQLPLDGHADVTRDSRVTNGGVTPESQRGHADVTPMSHDRVEESRGETDKRRAEENKNTAAAGAALVLVPPPDAVVEFVEQFKDRYPARNGKRVGIDGDPLRARLVTVASEAEEVLKATDNYAAACKAGRTLAVDPTRFFRSRESPNGLWRDWVEPDSPQGYKGKAQQREQNTRDVLNRAIERHS